MVTTTNYVCSVASPVVAVNALAVDDATSTITSTHLITVTSCAPTVTGCPGNSGGSSYPTSDYPTSEPSPTATTIGCVGNPVTSWRTVTTVCTEHLPSLFDTRSRGRRDGYRIIVSHAISLCEDLSCFGVLSTSEFLCLCYVVNINTQTPRHPIPRYPLSKHPMPTHPLSDNQCPDSDFSDILCLSHRVHAME